VEAGELGAEGKQQPLFLPTPGFMASAEEEQDVGARRRVLCSRFCLSLLQRIMSSWDWPERRAKGACNVQTADGKRTLCVPPGSI